MEVIEVYTIVNLGQTEVVRNLHFIKITNKLQL